MATNNIRIIFMGTPDFAVASLSALLEHGYDVCAVVTAPDRPAGRGQKIRASAVKVFASNHSLPILQPDNLKDTDFIKQLRAYKAKLFIVVAFRMLPEEVWGMPPLGTFNLHASLLPQYRGAAPINRTIMNGDTKGGVTSFFLRHEIDTGNIIFREETDIDFRETAGEYHDRLMYLGALLVIKTVEAIKEGNVKTYRQDDLLPEDETLKKAPKIHKEDCRINWSGDAENIYNHIRGLSPYPGAFTEIKTTDGKELYLKVFLAEIRQCRCDTEPGTVMTDYKTYLNVCCKNACISLLELQQSGKKRMPISEFLMGLNTSSLE
ncbi:MAG: methionyl-tRNA formyltransferase [Bacteroidales bacterium]|nr:methionyl-tRNA formyltransferase [Bacteroidales bacterium]